jgi:hypothetical protein
LAPKPQNPDIELIKIKIIMAESKNLVRPRLLEYSELCLGCIFIAKRKIQKFLMFNLDTVKSPGVSKLMLLVTFICFRYSSFAGDVVN